MPQPKITYLGSRASKNGLIVSFTVGESGVKRVASVCVPWIDLLTSDVGDGLSRAASRQLISRWSDVPLPDLD